LIGEQMIKEVVSKALRPFSPTNNIFSFFFFHKKCYAFFMKKEERKRKVGCLKRGTSFKTAP